MPATSARAPHRSRLTTVAITAAAGIIAILVRTPRLWRGRSLIVAGVVAGLVAPPLAQSMTVRADASGIAASEMLGTANRGEAGPAWIAPGRDVNLDTGNLSQSLTDITVSGHGLPLDWTRTYNSLAAAAASSADQLGWGWRTRYAASLSVDSTAGMATVQQGNGSTVMFTLASGSYTAPPRVIATLATTTVAGAGYAYTLPDQTTELFNATGRLVAETDRHGYITALAYDPASGRLTTVTDPEGRTLAIGYDGSGRLASVTDPIARAVSYGYSPAGDLQTVIDVGRGTTTYTYDGLHRLRSATDPLGNVRSWTYAASGRVATESDGLGRVTSFGYAGGTTTMTSPGGHVTVEQYTNHRLAQRTRGYGSADQATWVYGYDGAGNCTSTLDPRGNTWTAVYDAHGNRTSWTDPMTDTTTATYDAMNNQTSLTYPGETVSTTFAYSARGDLVEVYRPLDTHPGQVIRVDYQRNDPAHPDDVTAVVDANLNPWTLSHNPDGTLAALVDPTLARTTWAYNGIGWRMSMTTPRGNASGAVASDLTTTVVRDAFGDVTETDRPAGRWTKATYDGDRNVRSIQESTGATTQYGFDAANQPTTVTYPGGAVWTTVFDSDGNVQRQQDGLGQYTLFGHDALGELQSVTDPLLRRTSYAYDGDGNLVQKQDAASVVTAYQYDAANRSSDIQTQDGGVTPEISFDYMKDGQRKDMYVGTGATKKQTAYAYDSLHQVLSTTGPAGTVGYAYDNAGNVNSIAYPAQALQASAAGVTVGSGTVLRFVDTMRPATSSP